MIHQNNPLTHFFNLHSAASGDTTYRSETDATDDEEIDVDDSVHNKCPEDHHHTELDMVSGSVGKSFTIAAILGLKAAAAVASTMNESGGGTVHSSGGFKPNYTSTFTHNHLSGQRPFNDVMNLTLNSSLLPSSKAPPSSSSYETIQMNRWSTSNSNNQSSNAFLANSFQHHHHHSTTTGSALQNLQKLHQQHVSASNSMGHGNGFRLMNRSGDLTSKSKSQSALKSKRVRTIFTPEQLERLEAEFERQQYMVGPERLYLAHTLQLTEAQVKVWFQNRRIKWRKHHLELTQQRLAILRQRQLPATGSNSQQLPPSPLNSPGGGDRSGVDLEEVTALSTDSLEEDSACNDN